MPVQQRGPRSLAEQYAASHSWSWAGLAGIGAASAILIVPATHLARHMVSHPYYTAPQPWAISADRPDFLHTDLLEPWLYQLLPQAGTARTDVITGPMDPWSERVARERYGRWGPSALTD